MTSDKPGNFEDLLKLAGDGQRPIMLELRSIFFGLNSEACETVRIGYKSASYALGSEKMNESYGYIVPNKTWVNLGFYQGAHLDDPEQLLEGGGKHMRHIKIRSIEDCNLEAVKALINAASLERQKALAKP